MAEEEPPLYKDVPENSGAPPPTYQSDVAAEEARPVMSGTEPPPSYDSLFGKIKEARTEHGNSFGFFKALLAILGAAIGGIVCVACVAALMAFPIAQLVIGLQNQDQCTINNKIPLFLIVSGACGCAAAVLQIMDQMCCSDTDSSGERRSKCPCLGFILHLLNLFCFAWFICGNVWVYKIHKTVDYDDPASEEYCGKLVYLFAFWSITAVYVALGATCVIGCGCVCLMACLG
ncbi:transmembrane protein 272 isoform X1 [Bolinopsis microptera]|uniref:transmembrane protein 272 isoform X1 n=1 Tax=Bolinopsis microptera TaxID=2820187 RepID=UPI00307AAA16